MKKMKKLIALIIGAMMAIGFNVVPAEAYQTIGTGVTITASGTIVGNVLTFEVKTIDQGSSTPDDTRAIAFPANPSGIEDSERALKITGGTNMVDAAIIVYTVNANNTYDHDDDPDTAKVPNPPNIDPTKGVDGSGMVGKANAGYTVPLVWGAKTDVKYGPNENINYAEFTQANLDDGKNIVYIVDKRHTHSFTDGVSFPIDPNGINWSESDLDNKELYKMTGTTPTERTVANTDNDDLYPQLWYENLYHQDPVINPTTAKVVSAALYSSIATIAYGIGAGIDDSASGGDDDSAYYVCQMANLTTPLNTGDFVKARLGKIDKTTGEALYVYIGGIFTGPAQDYETDTLTVEMVAAE